MMNRRIKSAFCILLLPLLLLFSACAVTGKGESSTSAKTTVLEDTVTSNTDESTTESTQSTSAGVTATVNSASTVKGETTKAVSTTAAAVKTTLPIPPNTVSLRITCVEAVEYIKLHNLKGYENIVPKNGIMLDENNIKIQDNDTVLDVLIRMTKDKKITLIVRSGYVSNIGGLAASDERQQVFGSYGGWIYYLNGIRPGVGAASVHVKPGDKIEFQYVTKYTEF